MSVTVDSLSEVPNPQIRRWSRRSLLLAVAALIAGVAGGSIVLLSSASLPQWLSDALGMGLWLAAPLAVSAMVCSIIGLARREGPLALAGLGVSLVGVAPVVFVLLAVFSLR